jgi:hypothetical protein
MLCLLPAKLLTASLKLSPSRWALRRIAYATGPRATDFDGMPSVQIVSRTARASNAEIVIELLLHQDDVRHRSVVGAPRGILTSSTCGELWGGVD